ncbi:Odorant receptor 35 [Blattella germanica]|nr:Odorant receptor 35 [Blattella germanica]
MTENAIPEQFHEYEQNIFDLNKKWLYRAGIVPLYSIKRNPFKMLLYKLFILMSYILYFPTLIGQLLALYHFWGQLNILINGLYNMVACLMCYIIGTYGLFKKNEITQLFVAFEHEILPKMANVILNERKIEIFKTASKRARKITWIVIIVLDIFAILWIPVPLTNHYLKERNGTASELDDGKTWIHFCFLIWFPYDIRVTPYYEIMYLSQVILFFTACSYLKAVSMSIASLMVHIAGQFEILSETLADIDELLTNTAIQKAAQIQNNQFLHNNIQEMADELPTSTPKTSNANLSTVVKPLSQFESKEENLELIADSLEQKKCFINIVKYHQSILWFLEDLNRVSGPVILASLFSCQFLGCLMIFLMTLEWAQEKNSSNFARYIFAFICAMSFPISFCWYGNTVTESANNVRDAIYKIQWNRHTKAFNKDLLLLGEGARKQVYISGMQFYKLSLETLREMMSTMYSLYTLLHKIYHT